MTLDAGRVARGAARGFTVLLLGGIVQPWVGTLLPVVGYYWLVLVAVAAFMAAATGALPDEERRGHWVDGTAAAVASYVLVLPLVASATGGFPVQQALFTTLTALIVGTAAAVLRVRRLGVATPTGDVNTP